MDRSAAEAEIKRIFSKYKTVTANDDKTLKAMTNGKVYELFVLSEIVERLAKHGYSLNFVGRDIRFKGSPGLLKQSDPHFDISRYGSLKFQLFVSVEFNVIRPSISSATMRSSPSSFDDSCHHEIDVGVFKKGLNNVRPNHDEVFLAVECKSGGNFSKDMVRGILGLRRSLSLLKSPQKSNLFKNAIPADPPSEVILAAERSLGSNWSILNPDAHNPCRQLFFSTRQAHQSGAKAGEAHCI